jgi:hypothetical protein
MEDELATSKSTPGQEDEYMEDEGEGDESVRVGVRVLDEDSDGEEEVETTGGGTQQMGAVMLKDVTALSTDCVSKDSFEKTKKIESGSVPSEQKVTHKTSKTNPPPVVPASSAERHGSNVKRFPQQYYQIRANRLRTTTEVTLGGGGHGRKG